MSGHIPKNIPVYLNTSTNVTGCCCCVFLFLPSGGGGGDFLMAKFLGGGADQLAFYDWCLI